LLQIDDVLLESLDFDLSILELFQKFQGSFVGLVDFLLEFKNVIRGVVKFVLKGVFLGKKLLDLLLSCQMLIVNISLMMDSLLVANDGIGVIHFVVSNFIDGQLMLGNLLGCGQSKILVHVL